MLSTYLNVDSFINLLAVVGTWDLITLPETRSRVNDIIGVKKQAPWSEIPLK